MCSSPHWQVGSSWFREKLSPVNRNKGYRGEQISRKIVSRELNARSYRDFVKNIAFLGATSAKFAKSVGKKMGSNMRPRYIQFRDIHNRDISSLHCNLYSLWKTRILHHIQSIKWILLNQRCKEIGNSSNGIDLVFQNIPVLAQEGLTLKLLWYHAQCSEQDSKTTCPSDK